MQPWQNKRIWSADEILDFMLENSKDMDREALEEYLRGAEGVLEKVPVASLKEGNPDNNIRNKTKENKYMKMDPATMPPLIVENGKVMDGNHRLRVLKALGVEDAWVIDLRDASEVNSAKKSPFKFVVGPFRGDVSRWKQMYRSYNPDHQDPSEESEGQFGTGHYLAPSFEDALMFDDEGHEIATFDIGHPKVLEIHELEKQDDENNQAMLEAATKFVGIPAKTWDEFNKKLEAKGFGGLAIYYGKYLGEFVGFGKHFVGGGVLAKEEPRFHWKKEDTGDGFEIFVTEIGTDAPVGGITVVRESLGDFEDGTPYFLTDYIGEKFLSKMLEHPFITDIRTISVDPHFRNQGIAKYIYNLALKEIKKKYPKDPIYILASPIGNGEGEMDVDGLIDFYSRAGFKVLKRYPNNTAVLWMDSPTKIKLVAADKDQAGIADTDFPYYHTSEHPETPSIPEQPMGVGGKRVRIEPKGIFLFPKGELVDVDIYKKRKYRWDAKIRPGAKILNLDDNSDMRGFREYISYDAFVKNQGDRKLLDYYSRYPEYFEDYINDKDYDLIPKDQQPREEYFWEWLEARKVYWGVLVICVADANKLTEILKSKSWQALNDPDGINFFIGEPQLVVLDPSIIEWGPREENVPDKKVYRLAGSIEFDWSDLWVKTQVAADYTGPVTNPNDDFDYYQGQHPMDNVWNGISIAGKQVGVLYHFTTPLGFYQIVEDGWKLRTVNREQLSFTRDFDLKFMAAADEHDEDDESTGNTHDVRAIVRITVDGDVLSHKYKIKPFADGGPFARKGGSSESEQIIPGTEADIGKAVLQVDMLNGFSYEKEYGEEFKYLDHNLEDVGPEARSHGIEFNAVGYFTPYLGADRIASATNDRDLSVVYHVGALDAGRKKPNFSLEGNGLSISQDPEAWAKIARLGGLDTYELEKQNPKFYFADRHDQKAIDWGLKNGFLAPQEKFLAFTTDEDGEERYMEFDTREEAEQEIEGIEDARVEHEIDGVGFGPKGIEYWEKAFSSPVRSNMAEDLAPVFFAEANGYDGVWWEEELDPENFSAPRGVIFQGKLSSWKKEKIDPKKAEANGWYFWESKNPYNGLHPMDDPQANVGSPTERAAPWRSEPPGADRHPLAQPLVAKEGTSKAGLEKIAKWYIDNIFKDPTLPLPDFRYSNALDPQWLGRCRYKSGQAAPIIDVQRSILGDEKTLDRVLAHEMIHFYLYLRHPDYIEFFSRGTMRVPNTPENRAYKKKVEDLGHGADFNEWADRINKIKGKDYVTEKSDSSYVQTDQGKEFFIVIEKRDDKFGYNTFSKKTAQIKWALAYHEEKFQARIFKINDKKWLAPKSIGFGAYVPNEPERQKWLKEKYESGEAVAAHLVEAAAQFLNAVQDWNGKTKLVNGISLDGKVYPFEGAVIDWVRKNLNIPEPDLNTAIQDPATTDLPDDFFRIYKPMICTDLSFKLYDLIKAEDFQDFVLKVLLQRKPLPQEFSFQTLSPAKQKTLLVTDFMKKGKLSLNAVEIKKPTQADIDDAFEVVRQHLIDVDPGEFAPGKYDAEVEKQTAMLKKKWEQSLAKSKMKTWKMSDASKKLAVYDNNRRIKGKNLENPIVVADIGGYFLILDGNHRFLTKFEHGAGSVDCLMVPMPWAEELTAMDSATLATLVEAELKVDHHTVMCNPGNCRPGDLAAKFKDVSLMIPNDALYGEHPYKTDSDGRETEPHVTVLYGLKNDSDLPAIVDYAATLPPITFKIGKVSAFRNADKPYDVLKIAVDSPSMEKLHYWIRENFENACTFPFSGHMTLAYIKKGTCKDLEGSCDWTGESYTCDTLTFSHKTKGLSDFPMDRIDQERVAATAAGLEVEAKAPPQKLDESLFKKWRADWGPDDEGVRMVCGLPPYGDEEPTEAQMKSWFMKRLREVQRTLNDAKEGDGLVIFRCMEVPPNWVEELKAGKIKKLGHHWTIDRDLAPFLCNGTGGKAQEGNVILEAYAPMSEIDLLSLFSPNWTGDTDSEEFEVGPEKMQLRCVWDHQMKKKLADFEKKPLKLTAQKFSDEGMVAGNWGSQASGILFKCGPRILLLKRAYWTRDPLLWGIPGGAVPVDETGKPMDVKESAEKETAEEIGGVPGDALWIDKVVFQDGKFQYTTFLVEVAEEFQPILNDEHTAFAWSDAGFLPGYIHPGVEWAVEQFMERKELEGAT